MATIYQCDRCGKRVEAESASPVVYPVPTTCELLTLGGPV